MTTTFNRLSTTSDIRTLRNSSEAIQLLQGGWRLKVYLRSAQLVDVTGASDFVFTLSHVIKDELFSQGLLEEDPIHRDGLCPMYRLVGLEEG